MPINHEIRIFYYLTLASTDVYNYHIELITKPMICSNCIQFNMECYVL